MTIPDITINISANVVAWYAATVSTVALVILWLQHRKDRAIIKLTVQHRMSVTPNNRYSDKKTYTILTVQNHGHRVASIDQAQIIYENGDGEVIYDPPNARKIHEGESTIYMIEEKEHDERQINFYRVVDALGKSYTCKPAFKKH